MAGAPGGSTPTLYIGNKNYSSWSLRPWLALKQARIPFGEETIPLDHAGTAGAIRAVSPSGRVPALAAGDRVIWESLAICEWAAERAPEAHLWPIDAAERAQARSVACEMHAGFAAMRQAMCMNVRRPPLPIARDAAVDADIARVVELWGECRARSAGRGDFLFGHFTIADAMFAPVVSRFRSYAVPLAGAAAAYADAVWRLPAMREWVAAAVAEPLRIEKYEAI